MLMLISPAKKQEYAFEPPVKIHTLPKFNNEVKALAQALHTYSSADLQKLMSISVSLGDLNAERYKICKIY